jgi:hypothetical protein
VIHDATVNDTADLELMRGITAVEATLLLTDTTLTTTIGLEALESVGRLELINVGLKDSAEGPGALAGLANLKLISGDLVLTYGSFTTLDFNPELRIGGNVSIEGGSVSCATAQVFEDTLRAHGFTGSVQASFTGGCQGMCNAGNCQPAPG